MPTTSQTVTVLFSDLVGSTELLTSLVPSEADDLRRQHFSLLRRAITATGGNEVKSLGDGLMVTFSSLSRALACAVGMQQSVQRHNRRAERQLSIRIGMSCGEATVEDGDFFGEPVIEAARLCAQGQGGQILTTSTVQTLSKRHTTQEFVALGEALLKGLPEPIDLVEVRWMAEAEAQQEGQVLPLPARLVVTSSEGLFTFFGRTTELEALDEIDKRSLVDRHLGLALISGEPGVGKTALVARAARTAHDQGRSVLYGGCQEDLTVPYKPWIEALAPLVQNLPEDVLYRFAQEHDLAVAQLLPNLARRLGQALPTLGTDSDAERFLIMEGVVRLLASASETNPLLLVLDDLHWADAASLQLLGHLAHSSLPMQVSVFGTFRDSDLSRGHALTSLLANLHRVPGVRRMTLLGLEDLDIVGLMESAAGHALPEEGVALAHALRRETGGNPFFAIELLRHLVQQGTLAQGDDGTWRLTVELDKVGLPSSIREVVGHRVATLGPEAERALSMASVIGRDFDLSVLAEVMEVDELELSDVLEQATSAGILSETGDEIDRYRFVHALIQHTLYQDLNSARRQRAHQRVAEVLERTATPRDQRIAELARHWMAATRPTDVSKALHYSQKAGDLSLASYSPLDAISWYSQALELLNRHEVDDEKERCRLLVGLGTARFQAGQPEYRDDLREGARIAQDIEDSQLLILAALGASQGLTGLVTAQEDQIALLTSALEVVPDHDVASRARLLVALAEATDAREWELRMSLADEAVSACLGLEDEAIALDVAIQCFPYRVLPERHAERVMETKTAVETADRLGDVVLQLWTRDHRIHVCMQAGDLSETDQRISEYGALVERTGLPFYNWTYLLIQTWRRVLSGDLVAAERMLDEAFRFADQTNVPKALEMTGALFVCIRRDQGRLDELHELFLQFAADNPAIPALRASLVTTYCARGQLGEARQIFERDVVTGFTEYPRDYTWLSAIMSCADASVALRHVEAANMLLNQLEPFADLVAFPLRSCEGAVARALGRLSHLLRLDERADSYFQSALSTHDRLHAPYWLAMTRLDYSDYLIDRRVADHARATEFIGLAIDAAHEFGYGALERRGRAALRASRGQG